MKRRNQRSKSRSTFVDESERHLVKADFRYDEERDGFHCPGGQLLKLKTTRSTAYRV